MAALPSLVRRYYAYAATNSLGFYLPVGVLYLTEYHEFGLDVIGFTQGVFSLGILFSEIPTGYLGDRLGRRASLAIGHVLEPTAMVTFVLAETPTQYVAIYLLWAVGYTFRSGTEDAWLYEVLAREGAAGEFSHIKGRANTVLFATSASTALVAGVLASHAWAIPFLANATLSLAGLPLLFSMPATAGGGEAGGISSADGTTGTAGTGTTGTAGTGTTGTDPLSIGAAGRTLRAQLTRPEIRWFVAIAALLTAGFSVTRAFEQPAAAAVGVPLPAFGAMYAGFKLLSAGVSSRVGWLEDHLGIGGVFALSIPLLCLASLGVAVLPLFVLPVLFLNRAVKSIQRPLRNQYLNDRLADTGRATVLSGVSMVVSLTAASAKFVAGALAVGTGPTGIIAGAGVLIAVLAGGLWGITDPVRDGRGIGDRVAHPAETD